MAKPKQSPARPKKRVKDLAPKTQTIKGGRDSASGLPTGKRMHKP